MPPPKSGGPLKKDEIELLRAWIEQGAVWEGFFAEHYADALHADAVHIDA